MHVNEIAHYLWKSFNLNLLLNIQVLWRASVSMNNCDVLIFFTHFMFPYALFVSQLNLSDVDTSDIVLLKEG